MSVALIIEFVVVLGVVLLLDVWMTWAPSWWPGFNAALTALLDGTGRAKVVAALLAVFGLPSVLLVSLLTLAIPALSPHSSLRLFLLDPAYRRRRPFYPGVTAPGSPFLKALQMLLWLDGALVGLALSDALHLGATNWPLLAIVVLPLSVFSSVLLLQAVLWVLRVRQPSEAVAHLVDLSRRLIAHIQGRRSDYLPDEMVELRDLEVAHMRELIASLQQIALRGAQDGDAAAAILAIAQLGDVRLLTRDLTRQLQWVRPGGERPTATNTPVDANSAEAAEPIPASFPAADVALRSTWLDTETVEALGAVLLRQLDLAPEGQEAVVASALHELDRIAHEVLRLESPDRVPFTQPQIDAQIARQRTATALFGILTRALGQCVRRPEHHWRRVLLERVIVMLSLMTVPGLSGDVPWTGLLRRSFRELTMRFGALAVFEGDEAAIRSLLLTFEDVGWALIRRTVLPGGTAVVERDAANAALDLGALAVALGRISCARRLLDWLSFTFDRQGDRVAASAAPAIGRQRLALRGHGMLLGATADTGQALLVQPDERRVCFVLHVMNISLGGRRPHEDALRLLSVALEALADRRTLCLDAWPLIHPEQSREAADLRLSQLEARARALPAL